MPETIAPKPSRDLGDFARRDRYVVAVANGVLRLASRRYRQTVRVFVMAGIESLSKYAASRSAGEGRADA